MNTCYVEIWANRERLRNEITTGVKYTRDRSTEANAQKQRKHENLFFFEPLCHTEQPVFWIRFHMIPRGSRACVLCGPWVVPRCAPAVNEPEVNERWTAILLAADPWEQRAISRSWKSRVLAVNTGRWQLLVTVFAFASRSFAKSFLSYSIDVLNIKYQVLTEKKHARQGKKRS